MVQQKIDLYCDPVSPWSYLAWTVLKRYQKIWDIDIEIHPVFLGAIMIATGNKPPVTLPVKGQYMSKWDMPNVSKYFGVHIKSFSGDFPPQSLHVSRFLRTIKDQYPHEKLEEVMLAFWRATFKNGDGDLLHPRTYESFLVPSVFSKEELNKLFKDMLSEENKARIKTEGEALGAKGCFGFPWMIATREDGAQCPFFGTDRLEILGWWLGKTWNGPFPDGYKPKADGHDGQKPKL